MNKTSHEPQLKTSGKTLILLLSLFLVFGGIAWCGMLNHEDLHHCVGRSFDEGLSYMFMAYMQMNARLGEMSFYLIGSSPQGDGAYYVQFLHYALNPIFLVSVAMFVIRIALPEIQSFSNKSAHLLLFIALCMLGSKQNLFWFDGNLSWLYPCTLAMLFFILWEGIFQGNFKVNMWKFLFSIPLSVVVGMSNENTSIVSLLLFMGCGVRAVIRQRRFCVTWQYAVIAVLLFASAVLFYTAPCRALRAASSGWELSLHNILFNSLLNPANWMYLIIFYWREAIIVAIMLFIACKRGVNLLDARMACLVMVLVLLWGILLPAPCWGAPRAFTPLDLMLFAIMARMFYKIANHDGAKARDRGLIMTVRVVSTLTVLVPTVVLALAQYRIRCQIEELAEAALARGETCLVLHKEELDTSAVMPRYFHIPGFVVSHDLEPYVPLIGISAKKYENTPDFTHHRGNMAGLHYPSCGDEPLNRGVAKRFGLKSIIYIQ